MSGFIDRQMSAPLALSRLLQPLLKAMAQHTPGVLEGSHGESLHDFRVALRRTRTALSQLRGVLPARQVAWFREEFAWLATQTNAARDLDVLLEGFSALQSRLPKVVHKDLQPCLHFLHSRRQREYQQLTEQLLSPRHDVLLERWRDFLGTLGAEGEAPGEALPIAEIAGRRIWKAYRRILREAKAISADSPPAELHELRKSCKKLRYLLEFFQSLYPLEKTRLLIRSLKDLQDYLGRHQDVHVYAETLQGLGCEMAREGQVSPATLLALGRLLENLDSSRRVLRQEFPRCFGHFSREKIQRIFRELFKPQEPGEIS